jgi:hypothetical protein
MGMCRRIRSYSSHHEWVGNLFSLLAVVLMFGSIWATLQYYSELASWVSTRPLLHVPALVGALVAEVLLIITLLAIGSARADETPDKGCFATFQGRRSGGSPIAALRNWVLHMENVGKKHR